MPSVEIVLFLPLLSSYRHNYALYTTQYCSDSVSEINTVSPLLFVSSVGQSQIHKVPTHV